MKKISFPQWHTQNGERARRINELLQELVVATQQQYSRSSWEFRKIKSIEQLIRLWRDRMDDNQFSEIKDRDQKSCWFGSTD